jgi:hypothetical protein
MVSKPDYIRRLEDEYGKPYSTLELEVPEDFPKYLDGRAFTIVFSDNHMEFETGEFKGRTKIYLTKQSFYLYLFKSVTDSKNLVIYYQEGQLNELKVFIGQLLKTYKNGAANSK